MLCLVHYLDYSITAYFLSSLFFDIIDYVDYVDILIMLNNTRRNFIGVIDFVYIF